MSACISSRGEYSSHEPDGEYVCTFCGVLDEDALIAELYAQRAEVSRLADGIAREVKRAERAAVFIARSRVWGDRTGQLVDVYRRHADTLRRILAGL